MGPTTEDLRCAIRNFLDNAELIEEHQGGDHRHWAQHCHCWLHPGDGILNVDMRTMRRLKELLDS